MDEAMIGMLGVGVVALVVGAPIAAVIVAIGARTRARAAEAALKALEARLAYLEWWAHSARASSAPQPSASPSTIPEVPAAMPVPLESTRVERRPALPLEEVPVAESPPIDAPPVVTAAVAAPAPAPSASAPALFPDDPSAAPPPARRAPDLEGVIGVRLFAWLGGAVLFIAAALFLQYSIEHELIAPTARVAIGLVAGTMFLVGGDAMRRRADWAGQALSGAGLGTLYASLFAARALYDLLPTAAAFGGMALVTLVAGALALRRDAYVLAVIGLLGGFATPILLSTGENRPVALFAYVAMLDLGVVVLSWRRRWHSLLWLSALGSVILYVGWAAQYLSETEGAISLLAAAILGIIFALPALLGSQAAPSGSWLAVAGPRAAAAFGAVAPFVAALAVAADGRLNVAPELLVAYLTILSLGTAVVAAGAALEWLAAAAPLLGIVTLMARVGDDLFPAERTATLVGFAVPATVILAAHFAAARFMTKTPFGRALARALEYAAIPSLVLAPVVILRILVVEPVSEPIAPLAGFVALHLLGSIALAATTEKAWLFLAANAAAVVTLLGLWTRSDGEHRSELIATAAVFMLALWSAPLLLSRWRRMGRLAWLSSGLALLLLFPFVYQFAREEWPPAALATGALVCALLTVGTLRLYFAAPPDDSVSAQAARGIAAALGAIALAFVTASVPIALDNQWITVAWGAEAAALAWLRRRIDHDGLVIGCALLAGATFVRLVANPWLWEYGATGPFIVVNWLLYSFGIPIASFFVAARLLRTSPLATRLYLPQILAGGAGVLCFVLMNAEIADAFTGTVEGGLRFSGQNVLEDMIYSLGWGVFAIGTLIIGIARRSRGARVAALVVLVLTFGKVFLHDLWQLGSLYRVGSMIGLAVALLGVSFLLQRFVLRSLPEQERSA